MHSKTNGDEKTNEALIKVIFLAVKMTVMLVRQTLLQLLLTDSHIVEHALRSFVLVALSLASTLFVLQSTRGLQKY